MNKLEEKRNQFRQLITDEEIKLFLNPLVGI